MRKHIGWLVVGTLIGYLASELVHPLLPLPTLLAWLVPLLVWNKLGKTACRQTAFLGILGLACIFYGLVRGVFPGWKEVFAANVPLLAMFAAVSFLSLTAPRTEESIVPKGPGALLRTAFGTHLLGALINLSILIVFGDRLQKNGSLDRSQKMVLARCFCAAAWWSPFFIATGVALLYAPEMQWRRTLVPGAVMAGVGILLTCAEVALLRKHEFHGYPLKGRSLALPLLLAAGVVAIHAFFPGVSILNIICVIAPAGALLFLPSGPRLATLIDFVENGITSVSSQFALFLAAGLFSAGLKTLIQLHGSFLTIAGGELTPLLFGGILGGMIFVGIFGVHPIISIAVVSPLLLPLASEHSQLGYMFLSSWAISTACSPLSGVGLTLVSRYQASPREILADNFHYAVLMWAAATVVNMIFF